MRAKTIAQQVNAAAARSTVPLSVFAELTQRCNLDCYYCYQKNNRRGEELPPEQWRHILEELAGYGSLYITFSGGEPLLRDDFLEIISCARAMDFAVSIITNGLLVTGKMAHEFARIGVMDAGVSFHAADAFTHDRLTAVPGSFDAALNAVRLLKNAGVKVLVKHTVSKSNFGQFRELALLADNEECCFECDSTVLPMSQCTVSTYALNAEQHLAFLREMGVKQPLSCTGIPDEWTLHCDAGRSLCGIASDGALRPCILMPVDFGNVTRSSFRELWEGERARQFRESESETASGCLNCALRGFCSRCHAVAAMETGNWKGPAPSLCARALASSKNY